MEKEDIEQTMKFKPWVKKQKPLQLFKRLILASSNEGDLVLDPFSGSGTTAIAAKQLKRNFIAFEKNEDFFKSSVKRYKEETAQLSLF